MPLKKAEGKWRGAKGDGSLTPELHMHACTYVPALLGIDRTTGPYAHYKTRLFHVSLINSVGPPVFPTAYFTLYLLNKSF